MTIEAASAEQPLFRLVAPTVNAHALRDRERFVALLDSPTAPNEALRRAVHPHADIGVHSG